MTGLFDGSGFDVRGIIVAQLSVLVAASQNERSAR